jgi:hypothetical protein
MVLNILYLKYFHIIYQNYLYNYEFDIFFHYFILIEQVLKQ